MMARERLIAAQKLANKEDGYEEALNEFIWFHNHALEETPSLYGVRLSFALAYWVELGKKFPKAKLSLEEIRDTKTIALINGAGDCKLFKDVTAINEELRCETRTHSLFVKLISTQPLLAESCSNTALGAIVKSGDFYLAANYIPHPEKLVANYCQTLNEDILELNSFAKNSRAAIRKAYIHIYADRVKLIVSILNGIGQSKEASHIVSLACKLIESATVKKSVSQALKATPLNAN
jgi:hypothetical protein